MSQIPELNHLQLPLNGIMSATNNFSERNYVGRGGFGRVYKGQLQPSGITVAVKRLDRRFGQGENEFLKEILMLASYKHENLVSLVGFCDQGQEKILVYKHEDNGSLDKHLASTNLTWEQRLRICVGAARGLDYLHNGVGEGHRVVHRDIKSSNILLDANWKAKISDFGLSKFAPKNQQFSFLVTNACGTMGYVDPRYMKTGVLTKESDVYSFGIVLFEVLCGRLAMVCEYEDERRFLSSWVKLNDKNNKLQQIIIPFLQEQMKPKSNSIFFKIALQCLNKKSQKRPTMTKIVKELETALEAQLVSYYPLVNRSSNIGGTHRPARFIGDENMVLRAPVRSLDNRSRTEKEKEELDRAIALSLEAGLKKLNGQADMGKLLADQSFVSSILASLPGVDPNDPLVKDLIVAMQIESLSINII